MAQSENGSVLLTSDMHPIDDLSRKDADVYVLFLSSNYIGSPRPLDDYWFAAHQPLLEGELQSKNITGNNTFHVYFADEASSPVACTEQFQICLPASEGSNKCTPLGTYRDTIAALAAIPGISESQQSLSSWTYGLTRQVGRFHSLVKTVGSSHLAAKTTLSTGLQYSIRDNQWQIEMDRLLNASLASLQGDFVRTTTGLSEDLQNVMGHRQNEFTKRLCANQVRPFHAPANTHSNRMIQKIRSNAYTNFSIFGISFLLSVGGIIIFLSYTLESFVFQSLLSRCWKRNSSQGVPYRRLEWVANGTLQLQRLAHEELGIGTWDKCDGTIPITTNGSQLAVLNIDNPQHPRLGVSVAAYEVELASPSKESGNSSFGKERSPTIEEVPGCGLEDAINIERPRPGSGPGERVRSTSFDGETVPNHETQEQSPSISANRTAEQPTLRLSIHPHE